MENRPDQKSLRVAPFAAYAARGLIRDPTTRRRTMFGVLIGAVLMLVAGSTFLRGRLDPHEHVIWFLVFWLACAWMTVTAMLLAVFDLISVRREERAARRAFRDALVKEKMPENGGIRDVE